MSAAEAGLQGQSWKEVLSRKLPLFGHRNWIVIADAAYPAQCGAGITAIATDEDHLDVVREVLAAIENAEHVRAKVLTDSELAFVSEEDAAGVEKFRARLVDLLPGPGSETIGHEEIIDRLGAAAAKFDVLVIKTRLTIPYTSVFIELDCGYWTAGAEARLRATMDS